MIRTDREVLEELLSKLPSHLEVYKNELEIDCCYDKSKFVHFEFNKDGRLTYLQVCED